MSIKLENITKKFGRNTVLDSISLTINDGDFATFLAPTGSGKTTLLRIMAGLEKPDSGRIYYDNRDVTELTVRERNIAMVYQDFVNYPSLTVYENIASPLRVSDKDYPEQRIDERVRETAGLLNISEILNKYPEEISGGQRQRTSIARALIKDVNYIFLDEPLANLDYKLREELRGQLKETFSGNERSGAIVYATADPLDALVLSTHVGYLNGGRVIQYDRVKEVYNNPGYVEVAEYFSHPTINIWESKLTAEKESSYLKVTEKIKVEVTEKADMLNKKEYLLGLRPQALSLEKQNEDSIPIRARVELCEVVGSDTELHLGYRDLEMTLLITRIAHYNVGEEIQIFIDPHQFYIFDKETHELLVSTGGGYVGNTGV